MTEQAQRDIARVRGNLQTAYQNAGENIKASWQQLDRELADIQKNLREGSVNVLHFIIDTAVALLLWLWHEDPQEQFKLFPPFWSGKKH